MNDLDAYKFQQEIKAFKRTIAPSTYQWGYLEDKKKEIAAELHKQHNTSGHSIERCLLTALCGTLGNKKEQAEFVTRLILLDLLTE